MAAPVLTRTGTAQSKTSGTTLAVTLTTTSYVLGDYVRVTFEMDPSAGAVSFAKTAGTATIGAWTTMHDTANGSGTSGARLVTAYAKVTAAGTITTVTVTFPAATAKSAGVYKVAGADGTTPVLLTGEPISVPVGASGKDCLGVGANAYEAPTGTTVTQVANSGWTIAYTEATSFGTSAGGAASNQSMATLAEKAEPVVTTGVNITPYDNTGTANPVAGELWVAPSGASPLTLTDLTGAARAADPADLLALGLTKTDAPTGTRAGSPKETLSLPTATPLTLTDRPTGSRSAGPTDSLALGLTLTDRPTGSRSGAPADSLAQGLTRTDSADGARAGKLTEALSLAGGPLTLTDRATAARAASPGDQLALGLVKTDGATAVRSGAPRDTLALGLTRTDIATGSRAGDPRETLTLGLLLTDAAGSTRLGRPTETLGFTGAPLTLTDHSGALRAAVARETLVIGLTVLDRAVAVRGGDGADLLRLGLTFLNRPSAIRLGATLDTVGVPAGSVAAVALHGADRHDNHSASADGRGVHATATAAHTAPLTGAAQRSGHLTGRDH